jgi:hypothetical protein
MPTCPPNQYEDRLPDQLQISWWCAEYDPDFYQYQLQYESGQLMADVGPPLILSVRGCHEGHVDCGPWSAPLNIVLPEPGPVGLIASLVLLTLLHKLRSVLTRPKARGIQVDF